MNSAPVQHLFNLLYLAVVLLVGMGAPAQAAPSLPFGPTEQTLSQKEPLQLLLAEQRTLDGSGALALVFSQKLDRTRLYDSYLTLFDPQQQQVVGGWVLGEDQRTLFFPHIDPETTYTVQIQPGLPALSGSTLAQKESRTLTTRAVIPAYGFVGSGMILPSGLSEGLPIMTVNVPEVDIEFLRVKDESLALFLDRFSWSGSGAHWDTSLDQLSQQTESLFVSRFVTGLKANRRGVTHIPVEKIPQLQKPGLYVAVMGRAGRFGKFKTTHFMVTDIGLHLRYYQQSISVYTSSLKSGKPLADVAVTLVDTQGNTTQQGVTDKQGRVSFSSPASQTSLLMAKRGGDITLLPLKDPALDLSEFPVGGPPFKAVEAFIYSPRDLYRPGEQLDYAILLRDHDGGPVMERPLAVRLKQPDGKEIARQTLPSAELGYHQGEILLPDDAQTGRWSLEVRVDPGQKRPDQLFKFQVEEFLPERMKLVLPKPTGPLLPEEPWSLEVTGSYLHGAKAAGNRLKVVANWKKTKQLPQWPHFYFGQDNGPWKNRREQLFDGPLDAEGKRAISLPLLKDPVNALLRVTWVVDLFESGGRPVTRSQTGLIWPSETLTGVRPLYAGKYAPGDGEAAFEVIKVNRAGQSLGAEGLAVRVIHENRNYYWSYREHGGWDYLYSESEYPILQTNLSFEANQKGVVRIPVTYGSYRLEITDPATGITSSHRFQAGWDWKSRAATSQPRPDRVNLQLDKKSYQTGETPRLTIIPPQPGEGLVLLESSQGLLWGQRLSLSKKGSEITLPPIQTDWNRHDIYLTVLSLRPGESASRITPNRALGLIHLPLDRQNRQLNMTLELPETIQPNSSLPVTIRLPDHTSRPTRVTVAAVDVGVLNITEMESPDPFSFFFTKRGYQVESKDIYGKVIENQKGVLAKPRFGGDAANKRRGKKPTAKVKILSLFSGPVVVDEQGIAQVSLPVGDFNGALRVMAVGFGADRFGAVDQEVLVAAPVIAEISTPRFLAFGDQSQLTLTLHNRSGQGGEFQLSLSASQPLRMAPVNQTLTLADNEMKTLRFPLSGGYSAGVGTLSLSVVGEGVEVNRSWQRMVRSPYPLQRTTQRFVVTANQPAALNPAWSAGLAAKTVEYQLQLSPRPPLNGRRAVKGLLGYPYGCLEQTTSRAFPLLFIDAKVAQEMGLEPLSYAERKKRLETAFKRLAAMQRGSGGFGLWDKQSPEEPWLTPYVVDFLLQAKKRGFSPPEEMLSQALNNLSKRLHGGRAILGNHHSDDQGHSQLAAKAYGGYLLAQLNKAPLGLLRNLFDQERKKARSPLPLVHLGLALHLQGDLKRGRMAFDDALARQRPKGLYLGDYGSEIRDVALTLALLEQAPLSAEQKKQQDQLLFALDGALASRTYWSTQERYALFLAYQALNKKALEPWKLTTTMGSESTHTEKNGVWRSLFTPRELNRGITLQASGEEKLYAEVEVSGFPEQPPPAISRPIEIQRHYFSLTGASLNRLRFKVGELFLVRLQVSSKESIEQGLVEDLLPAGLELENSGISKGEKLADLSIDGVSLAQATQDKSIRRQAFLEDRYMAALSLSPHRTHTLFYLVRAVTPGRYTLPPPLAEDMYRPDRLGIGHSETLIVEAP
ncbi:MAG: alpha-2-macroglobulin family protein [Magnetococcales bacterium]|nr:alpha-2-macroglobulin family protein [Magnetococcales bacterium]